LRWRGQSFSSGCGGNLSLVSAFAISSNTAALRLAQRVGLDAFVQKARDLGFTSPLAAVPGLALGQSEVTLLELTAAYAAIANGGVWHSPSTIRRLTDGEACNGQSSSQCRQANVPTTSQAGRRVCSEATARAMQQLLRAVVQRGTGQMASRVAKPAQPMTAAICSLSAMNPSAIGWWVSGWVMTTTVPVAPAAPWLQDCGARSSEQPDPDA
jgi:penicillin-binding protein 1A